MLLSCSFSTLNNSGWKSAVLTEAKLLIRIGFFFCLSRSYSTEIKTRPFDRKGDVKARLDVALGSLVSWLATLNVAGGLK